MNYFRSDNMNLGDDILIQRVIDDLKPGSHLDTPLNKYEGLVIVNKKFISKKRKVKEFISEELLEEHFSHLGDLLMKQTFKVFKKIRQKIVAKALAYLSELPRDYKSRGVITNRPEIALLEGLLYGFGIGQIASYVSEIINPQKNTFIALYLTKTT